MHRRPLIAAAVAGALAWAAPAAAEPTVRVERPDGNRTDVALATVPDPTLAAVIDSAGVSAFQFDLVDVGTLRLRRAEAFDGPRFVVDADGFRFEAAGETVPAEDDLITVVLSRRTALAVTATATPAAPRVGEPVTFTAAVTGAGEDQDAAVRWTFPDGKRASGSRVTHTFDEPGRASVVVGVSTAGDRAGASDVVALRVRPAAAPDPTPTPTPRPTPTPCAGAEGDRAAVPARAAGAGRTARTAGAGTEQAAAPCGGAGGGGTAGGGSGGASGSAGAGPATRRPRATPTPTPRPTATPTPRPRGTRVEGILLAGPAAAPRAAGPPAATVTPPGGGFSVPPEAGGALVVLAALAGGWRLESRRARRWPDEP